MRRGGIILFLTFLCGVLACTRESGEDGLVRFRDITTDGKTVVLEPGGKAEVIFQVTDPAFSFNYDVASPACQISLWTAAEVPYFRLSAIRKLGAEGAYVAVIEDLLADSLYEEQVCLAMRLDDGSRALSGRFTVRSSEAPDGRTTVRTGLPVVYVDTEGGAGVTSKDTYVPATFSIRGMGVADGQEEVSCSIRGRGNTTWWWPKKPYLVKLDEKQHVFGMHKHKRWVLLANFMDRTLMRNLVAMKVSSLTSLAWTPGCQSVELVLNGKHLGNYLLIEQVRVDNHRVDISRNGYLLELDFHYDNKVQWVDGHGRCAQFGSGIPFAVKYPDPDSVSTAQVNSIKNYISEAADALYGSDFRDPDKGYAKYLDVDSFIDYWIVFEVMGNHELGNPGSVFLHKEEGGKLVAGPCWDFDWGVLSYKTSPQAETGLVNGSAIWYARLFEDPSFKARVKARFQELLPQLRTIPAFIDETEETLSASAERNFQMWNPAEDASQNGGSIINGDENLSFHAAVERLRSIYEQRLEVIEKNL